MTDSFYQFPVGGSRTPVTTLNSVFWDGTKLITPLSSASGNGGAGVLP